MKALLTGTKKMLLGLAVLASVAAPAAAQMTPEGRVPTIAALRRDIMEHDGVEDMQREVDGLRWQLARELDRRALQEQKNKLEEELKAIKP